MVKKMYQNLTEAVSKDETRRALTFINVRKDGTAEATNGRLLVRVPLEDLAEGDVPGLLPAHIFKYEAKRTKPGDFMYFKLGHRWIQVGDGTLFRRDVKGINYPDTDHLFADIKKQGEPEPLGTINLNAELLFRTQTAMGVHFGFGVRLEFYGAQNMIIVRPGVKDNKAVGILMPIRPV